MTKYFLALALAAGALRPSLAHAAGETHATLAVALSLTSGDAAPVELTVTLADEHGCASVSERRRDAQYEVSVCRDGGDDSAPIIALDVERVIERETGREQRRFRVKARLAVNKTAKVAHYGEGKSALDVSALVTRADARS